MDFIEKDFFFSAKSWLWDLESTYGTSKYLLYMLHDPAIKLGNKWNKIFFYLQMTEWMVWQFLNGWRSEVEITNETRRGYQEGKG